MKLEKRKSDLVKWINDLDNLEVIETLEIIKEGAQNWWDTVPDNIQLSILESLKQADNGEFIEHEEVMKKYAANLK